MSQFPSRHEFVLFFDVKDGNPNGDPDMDNMPRRDPDTDHGIVTDVCLKRKVRNFVEMAYGEEQGYKIFVRDGSILNETQRMAYIGVRGQDKKIEAAKTLNPTTDKERDALVQFMCDNFFDVRSFGAMMATKINCGAVRGPIQFGQGRSVEPITVQEMSITRMAAASEEEKKDLEKASSETDPDKRRENRTVGRKHSVPYGLYRVHGFVSGALAEKFGFTQQDLDRFLNALTQMFDHDRSAARGEMNARRLIVFKHSNKLGNTSAANLFDRVSVTRQVGGERVQIGANELLSLPPARNYADYSIEVSLDDLPSGIEVVELI